MYVRVCVRVRTGAGAPPPAAQVSQVLREFAELEKKNVSPRQKKFFDKMKNFFE